MPAFAHTQMNRMAIEWHTKEIRWIKVAYIWKQRAEDEMKKKKKRREKICIFIKCALSIGNVRVWVLCILAHEMNIIWQNVKELDIHTITYRCMVVERKKKDLECNEKGVYWE